MAEQGVLKLVGFYLGRSQEPGNWRLYVTENLTRYLEFRKDDALHSERLSTGRIVTWLKADAMVEEKQSAVADDFLKGDLLPNLRYTRTADDIRRLLGLGLGICGGDEEKKKVTNEPSCNPQQCTGPACPKDSINNC
jgi:hypothetical protein